MFIKSKNVDTSMKKCSQIGKTWTCCISYVPQIIKWVNLKMAIMLLMSLLNCLIVSGQTITEKLILTDTQDSLYLNSSNLAFDKYGNYCFEIVKDEKEYFVSSKDTLGGFNFIGSIFGTNGEISHTSNFDPIDKPWFYRNGNGTRIYGNAKGKLENYITSYTSENVAITTTLKDSVFYYLNGKFIASMIKDSTIEFNITNYNWCAFSENGNAIYTFREDSLYRLFVNGYQIDSSKFKFDDLAINDSGKYIYSNRSDPDNLISKYSYPVYLHSVDTIFGCVSQVWNFELKNDGAYYFNGNDNGPYYIAVNNKFYNDVKSLSNIILINKNGFLYTFKEQDLNKINVNGENYTHDFEKIFFPCIDEVGNFGLFGIKDYYLYKYVNGKKEEAPITNYGVRAIPLYISPKGETIHYFKTDDSVYLYKNDNLLFKPISKKSDFEVLDFTDVLPHKYVRGKTENGNSLLYILYDSAGYFLFNGNLSNPMMPITDKSYSKTNRQGEIVSGKVNDYGFFAIQKTGESKYSINVNNKVYKELENVDYILKKNCFLDDKELIFYGVKDMSFYKFTLQL